MKSKKLIASTLVLSICSALLLTSCNNGNQGDKIGKKLEDAFGGDFRLVETNPQYDEIWPDINFPIPAYYMYEYEWDEAEDSYIDTVYVSTKGNKYRTNANYVKYYEEFEEYFTDELADWFPGEVVATYFSVDGMNYETDIKDQGFDDLLYEWQFDLDCIVAVEDVEDHEAVEKALDRIFGEYNIRVECDVISVDDVDRVLSQADTTEENKVRLYYNYKDVLPTHEYYIYISDTDVIRGATGWYEHKAR